MFTRRILLLSLFSMAACGRINGSLGLSDSDSTIDCVNDDMDRYFSFTLPNALRSAYFRSDYDPSGNWNVDTETLAIIRSALIEILQTPEGHDLISSAVTRYNGNKIHFDIDDFPFVAEADIAAGVPFIRVSNSWWAQRQTFQDNGQAVQLTMQRMLVHELYHFSAGHVIEDLHLAGLNREQHEGDAVRFTDQYMKKYYGDRSRERYSNVGIENGTDGWDFARRLFICRPSV